MNFTLATLRLGKTSVPDIIAINTSSSGILEHPFDIAVTSTQVPLDLKEGSYAIVWLGSDNSKGQRTEWKQGFKAIGLITSIIRSGGFTDEAVTNLSLGYIFPEAVSRLDILREAPSAYYWAANIPVIGLDDHSNQTVRIIDGTTERSDIRALFFALNAVQPSFLEDITKVYPVFKEAEGYLPPSPNGSGMEDLFASQKPHGPRNKVFFGAPGTGKSYLLREKASVFDRKCQERVTFYPTYTYQQFVGTYKPAMKNKCTSISAEAREVLAVLQDKEKTIQEKYDALYDSFNRRNQLTRLPLLLGICGFDGELKTRKADGTNASNDNVVEFNHGKALREYVRLITTEAEHQISYEYVPGPFLRLLAKAYQNPDKDYLLIIEELNRANAAAVFGDAFQLLDRKADGTSEYPIAMSEDMKQYFQEMKLEMDELFLPTNFYIWATMNSADQGVFPIDTAFKRRWDFEYLGIDTNEEKIADYWYPFKDGNYYWNAIRKAINAKLLAMRINEDKLLGPFFVGLDVLEADDKVFIEAFKSKVLMYLFEDAIRHNPSALFNGKDGLFSYSIICRQLEEGGLKAVFNFDIEQAKDLDEPDDEGGQGNA